MIGLTVYHLPLTKMVTPIFFLFAGLAIASAISLVYHKNPLYSAISLIGVLISLACIYITLAAPFIAAVQILIYAGAIMVLVVFVIMLLNLEEDSKPFNRLGYLYALGGIMGLVLLIQTFFIFYAVHQTPNKVASADNTAGLTQNIGRAMYTEYLLPVEVVGVLLLMSIIGAIMLSRRLEQPQIERVTAEREFDQMVERNDY